MNSDSPEPGASLPEAQPVEMSELAAQPLSLFEAAAVTPIAAAAVEAEIAAAATIPPDVSEQLRPGAWQYIGLGLALLSLTAVWGAGGSVLLPQQVAAIVGNGGKVAALGLVGGIAAIVALVVAPIFGALSDRTRSPLGRRNIWVLGGAIATALLLLFMGHAASIPLLIALWCGVQLTTNAANAAMSAVIPERFPISRRGTISAVTGIGSLLGTFVGTAIGGFAGSVTVGYIAVGVVALVLGVLWALTAREPAELTRAIALRAQTGAEVAKAAGAKRRLDLPRNPDYWWAFAGRFLIFLALLQVNGYQFYILSDYIKLGQTNPTLPVAQGVVILSGIFVLTLLPSTAFAGWLSDKIGRVKPFIFATSLGLALPMLLLLLIPSWPIMIVTSALNGLVFGMYLSVDQALMSRVLPKIENAARDLGILNIANAGPQVLAPFAASVIITVLGGYPPLFITSIVFAIVGALTVRQIRGVN